MKKNRIQLFSIIALVLVLAISCKKDEKKQNQLPVLTTNSVSDITKTNAICGGVIVSDGGTGIISRGVCWDTVKNPTIDDYKTNDGIGTGSYSSSIAGLTAGTTYYLRAYATNNLGTAYGNEIKFTTNEAPQFPLNLITNSSFEVDGQGSLLGWNDIAQCAHLVKGMSPSGGGDWSLQIPTGWLPFYCYIETNVKAPVGTNEYQFSIFMKNASIWYRGYAELYIIHSDSLIFNKRLASIDTAWRYYSLIDTLSTIIGDSLKIRLITSSGEDPSSTFFDLCKLEELKNF